MQSIVESSEESSDVPNVMNETVLRRMRLSVESEEFDCFNCFNVLLL